MFSLPGRSEPSIREVSMSTVDFDFALLPEAELFGAWLNNGQFICGRCLERHDVEDVSEGITREQVAESGTFFYCGICNEKLRAPRH